MGRKGKKKPPDSHRSEEKATSPAVDTRNASNSSLAAIGKESAPSTRSFGRRDWLFVAALVTAVFLAYQPVWQAGFIWDDDEHLTANRYIVGPLGIKDIWTTRASEICPLLQSTFWLEHAAWGLSPAPYHLVNILLHSACAVVLWQVLED